MTSARSSDQISLRKKVLFGLLIFKIFAGFAYCFSGFILPHVIRQNVTLGPALRQAIEWQHRPGLKAWFPRSLAGGDHDGIVDMEFPLINWLTAPAFFVGVEEGRALARIIFFLISVALVFWHFKAWEKHQVAGVGAKWPALLIALTPLGTLYFVRFMPDFVSFILCSIAVALCWADERRWRTPLIVATIGLLLKPTSVIAFAPILLLPSPIMATVQRMRWLIPAGGIMLVYYTAGVRYLRSISDLEPYYNTFLRNPLEAAVQFFSQPWEVFFIFNERLISPFFPLLALGLLTIQLLRQREVRSLMKSPQAKLWALLLIQFVVIGAFDGEHAFFHTYYFIGTGMIAALLFSHYLEKFPISRVWSLLMLLPLVGFSVEHSYYEMKDLVQPAEDSIEQQWRDCQLLKGRNPDWPWGQGKAFRSEISPISELGLCFGEIQSSRSSSHGFFLRGQTVPSECQEVDSSGRVILVICRP